MVKCMKQSMSIAIFVPDNHGNKGASSSVSDVYLYVIIIKLLDSIFDILHVFIPWSDIQSCLNRTFLLKCCLHKV
jgi:hypothetical protein